MPEDRTVLDTLLEGRDALQREVARLTAAIEQLDSVLGRLGSSLTRSDTPTDALSDDTGIAVAGTSATAPGAPTAGSTTGAPEQSADQGAPASAAPEPVNPPAEVQAPAVQTVPSRPRVARKAPAKKAARPARAAAAEPPKSIRVHVLEMLQAENRDFGLAEIIDRVHDAGIQAHDDAVRSITIKLMKDGRVERVGRGQYRLARRGAAARTTAAAPHTAPPATPEPAVEAAPVPPAGPVVVEPTVAEPTVAPTVAEPTVVEPEVIEPELVPAETVDEVEPGPADPGVAQEPAVEPTSDERGPYAPSLNLGQPWNN